MAGIPSELKRTCISTLQKSAVFHSSDALRQVLNVNTLSPYQGRVNYQGTSIQKIENIIDTLWDRKRDGKFVFVHFLEEVRDTEIEGDDFWHELNSLITQVQAALSGNTPTNISSSSTPSFASSQGHINMSDQSQAQGVLVGVNKGTINYYGQQVQVVEQQMQQAGVDTQQSAFSLGSVANATNQELLAGYQRILDRYEQNLMKVRERKAQFFDPSSAPLDLERIEQEIIAKIAEMKNCLK